MSTWVQGRRVRDTSLTSFAVAEITDAPVEEIHPNGVLFDGDLTDEQIGDCWWWFTSTDDEDQARRMALYDLGGDVADPALAAAIAYLLGTELPT